MTDYLVHDAGCECGCDKENESYSRDNVTGVTQAKAAVSPLQKPHLPLEFFPTIEEALAEISPALKAKKREYRLLPRWKKLELIKKKYEKEKQND